MGLSRFLRPSRLLAAAVFFLVGMAVVASALAGASPAGMSPAAPGVVPAAIDTALDDAQLTAADLALASGDAAGAAPAKGAGRPLGILRTIVGRTERAEITVATDAGTRTLLYVRGEITALSSGSVTVTISDGSRTSFAIAAATRVREKGRDIKLTDLSTGDRAMVFGLRNADGTYTATLIRCVREGARRAPPTSPAASPPG